MNVLYALGNYPQLSETYIAAEIAYALRRGVSVQIWTDVRRSEGAVEQAPVIGGSLADAIRAVKPELLHIHYVPLALQWLGEMPWLRIPVTVRGHSFDFNVHAIQRLCVIAQIRAVYLFPHFALQCPFPKIRPMPVAYDSTIYEPVMDKDPRLVVRLSAGRRMKGLDDFFAASTLCPDHQFVLAVAATWDDPAFLLELEARRRKTPSSIQCRPNLLAAEAAALTRKAGIYLDTSDPKGHPFGMPISIAEALATGSVVLARGGPAAQEYLSDAGFLYESPAEAAAIVKGTLGWSKDRWTEAQDKAVIRSRAFASDVVLAGMLKDWTEFTRK